MTFPKARLVVSAILFLGWLGFLLYVVVDSRTIILSKPQFLIAQLYVVVEVRETAGKADPEVVVDKVLWTSDPLDQHLTHQKLQLPDISACAKEHGYQGPDKYLVPLVKSPAGSWMIAAVPYVSSYPKSPPTHGTVEAFGLFSHRARRLPLSDAQQLEKYWQAAAYKTRLTQEDIRIYLWTPDTEAQMKPLVAAKK
jgi:hypothetical protein